MNKTAEAKRFVAEGDLKSALAIVKTFRRMDKQVSKSIVDAYECCVHRSFYENMRGAEWVEQKIEAGIESMRAYLNDN